MRPRAVKKQRAVIFRGISYNIRFLKMADQTRFALNANVFDCAYFVGLKDGPVAVVELCEKLRDCVAVQKSDKCISNVTFVFVVHGQIEEIIGTIKIRIDLVQQHALRIVVRDILHHHGRSSVTFGEDGVYVDDKIVSRSRIAFSS